MLVVKYQNNLEVDLGNELKPSEVGLSICHYIRFQTLSQEIFSFWLGQRRSRYFFRG